ncbi:Ubiquitinyl hydrolase 1 [Balamuthia mandrillaris]
MEEERRKREEWDGVEVQGQDLRSLILNYLLHHCYADTAKAFVAACNLQKAGKSQQGLHKNIHERKRVLELVREGQIEEAVAETEKHFPNVLKDHPKVRFQLHCQQFVEFIRQRDTKKALAFAQKELSAYAKEDPKDPSFLDPLQVRSFFSSLVSFLSFAPFVSRALFFVYLFFCVLTTK